MLTVKLTKNRLAALQDDGRRNEACEFLGQPTSTQPVSLERTFAPAQIVSGHEEVSKSRRLSALRPVVPSRPGLEEPTRIVAVGAVRNRVCAVLQAAVGALFASTGASASTARALARDGAFG